MNKLVVVARILLGLPFLVFGLNHFLGFLDEPEHNAAATGFLTALGETGYMWPLIKFFEILCGVLLITGRFVPLALVLLAPLMVNILAFHVFLEPEGIPMALVLLALQLFLVRSFWGAYCSVLRATPASTPGGEGA